MAVPAVVGNGRARHLRRDDEKLRDDMVHGRPRMLWFKAMLPKMVADGSSVASYNLAQCLAEAFDIDLVCLRLRGGEGELAPKLCPPFRRIEVVVPDNAGSVFRRAWYRAVYELRSRVTGVPRPAFYEACGNVRRRLLALASEGHYDVAHFEYWTSGLLLELPLGCPKVLLKHDAMHVTLRQQADRATNAFASWRLRRLSEKVRRFEVATARRADRVCFLSPWDRRVFEEQGLRSTGLVPIPLPPLPNKQRPLKTPNVLFLGRFEHYPNREALEWLVREIVPLVRRQEPRAVFKIAGPGLPETDRNRLECDGVEFLGWVEDLDALVNDVSVGVAPVRQGTGTKLKVLELMWHGLPVVTTPAAARGTPADSGGAMVAEDAPAFAGAVCRLLADRGLSISIRDRARDLLERHHCGPGARRDVQSRYLGIVRRDSESITSN